jgi:hypothetical protein
MQSVPNSFWEWMSALGPGERIPVIVLGMFALVIMVIFISGTVYKIHKNRLEDALKRELLERGMNADEIATVIRAKPGRHRGCGTKIT